MNPDDFVKETSPGELVKVEDGYAFVPNPAPRDILMSGEMIAALDDASASVGKLDAAIDFADSELSSILLFRPFIRREAVDSSKIEGTHTTFEELLRFEAMKRERVEDPRYRDALTVAGYVEALEYGIENIGSRPIAEAFIRHLHERMMQASGKLHAAGEYRKVQNYIGRRDDTLLTAKYVPPPVPQMNACMADFDRFINEENNIRPLIRCAVSHYQFEAIHPFEDGNGRIGRLLIPLLLCQRGVLKRPHLYISLYFERNRQAYYDLLLGVSTRGEWSKWIMFFLKGIEQESRDIVIRVGRLVSLRREMLARIRKPRSSGLMGKAVDLLFEHPFQSIGNFQRRLGLKTYTSAASLVGNLVSEGILEEVTGQKRDRLFASRAVVAAYSGPIDVK